MFAAILVASGEASAQAQGCTLQQTAAPARQVLRCRDGVTIEAEAGASFTLLDRDRNGAPDGATLNARALLIEGPARPGGRGFQVFTPQAIAAVRGTQWVVDVSGAKTAVFVVAGRVSVRRQNSRNEVSLGPGEGVDVEAGTDPLVVRRWPTPRASALLARFGR
ncbi:MAG: FecR domain-containing protein [Microvirga sp.]